MGIGLAEGVVVLEGINAGERVVLEGTDRLREGAKVRVIDPKAAAGTGERPAGSPAVRP